MQGYDDQVETVRTFHEQRPHRQRTGPRVWVVAFLLTILFHGAMILGILVTRPFSPTIAEAKYPEPIELVFASAVEPSAEKEEPTFFSELPPDRADEPPESPDFLSNVDSRERDLIAGGEENAMPRLEGSSDAPHIRMDPAIEPSKEPEPEIVQQDPQKQTFPEATPEMSGSDAQSQSLQAEPIPETTDSDNPPERFIPEPTETPTPKLFSPSPGVAEFFQDEMDRPEGNTSLSGIVSINTMAWDYAPWLQEFRRDFLRSWAAPVAYYMGIIDGWTVVELEIARDGSLQRLDVVEANGHDSLRQCSVDVFKALAPYRPLPEKFPERSLILRIKLVYPSVRRR